MRRFDYHEGPEQLELRRRLPLALEAAIWAAIALFVGGFAGLVFWKAWPGADALLRIGGALLMLVPLALLGRAAQLVRRAAAGETLAFDRARGVLLRDGRLECPRCGARTRLLAATHPPDATNAILECLDLPARAPPVEAARPEEDALDAWDPVFAGDGG